MRKICLVLTTLLLVNALHLHAEEVVSFPRFGDLHIYRPAGHPTGFLILVSGDGGWVRAAPVVAATLSKEGSLIAGVEIKKYLHGIKQTPGCVSVAQDFQELAEFIRTKYDLPDSKPVLIGYSSGATLVYAALAQASPGQFTGALSFGFCADFEPAVTFCKGNGLEYLKGPLPNSILLQPSRSIQDPWVTFQGSTDEVCDPLKTEAFTQQVSTGEFVLIPKAGHGFAHLAGWMPEFHRVWPRFHQDM
jgi:dienelactone hydrolase